MTIAAMYLSTEGVVFGRAPKKPPQAAGLTICRTFIWRISLKSRGQMGCGGALADEPGGGEHEQAGGGGATVGLGGHV